MNYSTVTKPNRHSGDPVGATLVVAHPHFRTAHTVIPAKAGIHLRPLPQTD